MKKNIFLVCTLSLILLSAQPKISHAQGGNININAGQPVLSGGDLNAGVIGGPVQVGNVSVGQVIHTQTSSGNVNSVSYVPLAPITGFVQSGSNVNFSDYVNNMYRLGIAVAGVLAVIMIVVGGIEYMTSEAIGKKEEGKDRIWSAIWGLILALASYIILATINPNLLNTSLNVKPVPGMGTTIASSASSNTTASAATTNNATNGTSGTSNAPTSATENDIRSYFATNGVQVNSQPCAGGQTSGCTTLAGLGQSAVTGVVALKNASGADITITGGTEDGHITHGVGQSIVDIRKDPTLNNYITSNQVSVQSTSVGQRYTGSNGTTYLDEGDHWHVVFP